ncbi:MAG TPA: O-antigen ligase family protein [Candidatus Limnocylindrales bacterium]
MSTRTAASPARGIALSGQTLRLWGTLLLVAGAAVVAARISTIGFVAMAALLLVVFTYVAFHASREMLTIVVLVPLVDRYFTRQLVPDDLQLLANSVSEGLLLILAFVILARSRHTGRIVLALRHPMTLLMAAFVAVAVTSWLVNGVSVEVAGLGIEFTIDAFVAFFLVRVVGFDELQGERAAMAFVGVALVAGFLSLGQIVLTPDFLGLTTWEGRFGEGMRPGSIFIGQPNLLGAVLALAVPFAGLAVAQLDVDRRLRLAGLAASLALGVAIVFTFSRGTWAALAISLLLVGLVLGRRTLVTSAALGALALAIALILPRGILLPPDSKWAFDLGNATFGRLGPLGEGKDLRFQFIENAIPIIEDHPILGTGPGTYGGGVASHYGSPNYSQYTSGAVPTGRTVDNYWLHVTVEFGLVGAALLVGMLALAVFELLRAARRSAGSRRILLGGIAAMIVILGATSATEMLLEGNTTSILLWFFIGIGSLLAAPSLRKPEADPVAEPAAPAPTPDPEPAAV